MFDLKISVVTNTINRPLELVKKSIRSSLTQEVDEVILVDQNIKKLKFDLEIIKNSRFKHQHTQVSSVSEARNLAQYQAQSEWLIFCDDDGYLSNDYIQVFKNFIKEFPEVDLIAGSIKRADTNDYYSFRHKIGGDMSYFFNQKLLMGSNFVVRKQVFESLEKFDTRFGAGAFFGSSEETDFAWKAYFSGYQAKFCRDLVVYHIPPYSGSIDVECKKSKRYGFGKGALVRKWLSKGKPIVLLEMIEMLVLPIVKIVQNLFLLRFSYLAIHFFSLLGRVLGLLKAQSCANPNK